MFSFVSTVANISLSCDTLEVAESVGAISVCAVLVTGDLAINVTVILNTNTIDNGAGKVFCLVEPVARIEEIQRVQFVLMREATPILY